MAKLTRKICMLSVDGGGIRGIIPAIILIELEKKLKQYKPDAKIIDYFDFYAGTSTGGLIVAGLLLPNPAKPGEPMYNTHDILELYQKEGDKIFKDSFFDTSLFYGAKFGRESIDEVLARKFGEARLKNLMAPCLITAYDVDNRTTHLFRQHRAQFQEEYDFAVKDMCSATSAAPTYFPPVNITNGNGIEYTLVDGGVVLNNPVLSAYSEVRKAVIATDAEGNPKELSAKDMFVISLGTGSIKKEYKYDKIKNWGKAQWAIPIIDVLMSGSAETMDYLTKKIFETTDYSDNYIRLDTSDLGDASDEMDKTDEKNINELIQVGKTLAFQQTVLLDKIAKFLIFNKDLDPDMKLNFGTTFKKKSLLDSID
jgi:patatin-like phospholipase/acyl hydrolase